MLFDPPLTLARFLGRRKRFFADVELADGRLATAHLANTGSMKGLLESGARALIRPSGASLPYALEALEADGTFVAVNTLRANQVAREALETGLVAAVPAAGLLRAEVVLEPGSRTDFVAGSGTGAIAIEVKSVTMASGSTAFFPDAVTERGLKHLRLLTERARRGEAALMLFMILREDARAFAPAAEIDPEWTGAFTVATRAGVRAEAIRCAVTSAGITPLGSVPVIIPA